LENLELHSIYLELNVYSQVILTTDFILFINQISWGNSWLKIQILLWVLGLHKKLNDLHSPWPSLYSWNRAALVGFAWKFERLEDQVYCLFIWTNLKQMHWTNIAKICAPRSILEDNFYIYSHKYAHRLLEWRFKGAGYSLLKYHRKWLSFFVLLSGLSCRVITVSHKVSGMMGEAVTFELLTDSLLASCFTSSPAESPCVTGSPNCWPFTSPHLPVFIASCFH